MKPWAAFSARLLRQGVVGAGSHRPPSGALTSSPIPTSPVVITGRQPSPWLADTGGISQHPTGTLHAGAQLLRLASLALAGNGTTQLAKTLLKGGIRLVEKARSGRCPCVWAGSDGCQGCMGRPV